LSADSLAQAAQAVWTGSLRASAWVKYRFRFEGTSVPRVIVDGEAIGPEGSTLSEGMHRLEIHAGFIPGQAAVLLWQQDKGPWHPVVGSELSPLTAVHGLTGTYFSNGKLEGPALLKRVDPLLALLGADFTLAAPFSVRWEGTLTAPVRGAYSFGLYANERAAVYLDDRLVVNNEDPDTYREAPVRLSAGPHPIRIEYQKKAGAYPQFVLYWISPGKTKQKVPYTALSPR
jgi:hypothetical protein